MTLHHLLAAAAMLASLPPGRAQGVAGPLAASTFVRTAIPDLQADLQQMIVAGDRVTVHYRIANGKIADNWHIEDNLTLMRQLGLVAR
jgi:predicted ester cyclase